MQVLRAVSLYHPNVVWFMCCAHCALTQVFVSCAGPQREMNRNCLLACDSTISQIALIGISGKRGRDFCCIFVVKCVLSFSSVLFVYDNRTEQTR